MGLDVFYQIKTEPQNFQITGVSQLREIEAVIGIGYSLIPEVSIPGGSHNKYVHVCSTS